MCIASKHLNKTAVAVNGNKINLAVTITITVPTVSDKATSSRQ